MLEPDSGHLRGYASNGRAEATISKPESVSPKTPLLSLLGEVEFRDTRIEEQINQQDDTKRIEHSPASTLR